MSFLDNSGTIILDAILTDIGRQRMTQGRFKITKVAYGDDEIDYRLYRKDAAAERGSEWTIWLGTQTPRLTDQSILSQSCFEALNQPSAVINYGLTSFERNDLIYLPTLKVNSGTTGNATIIKQHAGFSKPYQGVHYLSVNSETTKKLTTALGDTNYILENNSFTNTRLVVESGIDNTGLDGNSKNCKAFIMQTGLLDSYYYIYADSRFFSHIMTSTKDAIFKNNANGELTANFKSFKRRIRTSIPTPIDQYDSYMAKGALNRVYSNNNVGQLTAQTLSAIAGPRGSVMALGLATVNEIGGSSGATRNQKYNIFGSTGQTVFGGSDKYDFIDTTVYIVGGVSNAQVQIPVRIIRYAGT